MSYADAVARELCDLAQAGFSPAAIVDHFIALGAVADFVEIPELRDAAWAATLMVAYHRA
jgi:hypothetical protein